MQQEDLPVKPYALNYGVLFGAYSILILVLLYAFDYKADVFISILNFVITVAIVWYAIHSYKIDNGGQLSLTRAIKMGLAIGVIGGLIYAIYTYFHYEFIQPDYITEMIEGQEDIPEEASNVAVTPFILATLGILSIIFKTFLVGLIVGMIKRNN